MMNQQYTYSMHVFTVPFMLGVHKQSPLAPNLEFGFITPTEGVIINISIPSLVWLLLHCNLSSLENTKPCLYNKLNVSTLPLLQFTLPLRRCLEHSTPKCLKAWEREQHERIK